MSSENPTTPNIEPERLRAFFASNYDEILQFAIRHNMTIDRWPHHREVWALRFTPPQGGSAAITIRPIGEDTCVLDTSWYIDDYDASTRSLRYGDSPEYRVTEVRLTDMLREALIEMLTWRNGEWSQVAKDYEQIWHQHTREQFENMQIHW